MKAYLRLPCHQNTYRNWSTWSSNSKKSWRCVIREPKMKFARTTRTYRFVDTNMLWELYSFMRKCRWWHHLAVVQVPFNGIWKTSKRTTQSINVAVCSTCAFRLLCLMNFVEYASQVPAKGNILIWAEVFYCGFRSSPQIATSFRSGKCHRCSLDFGYSIYVCM